MTRIFVTALFALTALLGYGRSAIMVSHYGSSYHDTREKTIGKITADIAKAFPEMRTVEAYISPVVRKNMVKDGYESLSPVEMLDCLAAEGYDTVYVQCTTIIEGAETADVREAARNAAEKFKLVKVGNPLCYSPEDMQELVDILATAEHEADEAVVWCGHGNAFPSTATYAMLDYMLGVGSDPAIHVSTIEGYPTANTTATQLKRLPAIKKVKLIPLLLVCGNHTINDIAGDYAEEMRAAGYKPSVVMRGLAEDPAVRQLYVNRVRKLIAD